MVFYKHIAFVNQAMQSAVVILHHGSIYGPKRSELVKKTSISEQNSEELIASLRQVLEEQTIRANR